MKKTIIFLTLILCISFTSKAQNQSVDGTVNYGGSYWWFNDANNGLTVGDSTYTYTVRVLSTSELKTRIYVDADSVGGTSSAVTVDLLSKAFTEENYTVRETLTWHNGADTTFNLESDTARISEYWQLRFTAADDAFIARFPKLRFKFSGQ